MRCAAKTSVTQAGHGAAGWEEGMKVSESITENKLLPHEDLAMAWTSIVAADQVKERLLNQAILALRLRAELPFETTALHGLILAVRAARDRQNDAGSRGGTGARAARGRATRLIEVNPHGLMSAEHGQSQRRVFELLCEHVPALADDGVPTVAVLDEVESMAVARSAASLSANPADVHRATDAVLMALDRNARAHPHLIVIATSNFTDALDEAFVSRADVAIEVPLPDRTAAAAILSRALTDFAERYKSFTSLTTNASKVASELVGLDGRRIRKVVTEALAGRRETVLNPEKLDIRDLLSAAGD